MIDGVEIELLRELEKCVREKRRWIRVRSNAHGEDVNTMPETIEINLLDSRIVDLLDLLDRRRKSLERITLDQLDLSVRTYNALVARRGYRTVADLVKCSWKDLIKIPTFGRKSLAEVESALAERGLKLREAL